MTPPAPYVLDSSLRPAGTDVAGELYLPENLLRSIHLAGPRTAAEWFVADPFAGPGRRMYRTGEQVRRTGDGTLSPAAVPAGTASGGTAPAGTGSAGTVPAGAGSAGAAADRELAQVEFALAGSPGAHRVGVTRRPRPGGDAPVTAYVAAADGAPSAAELHQLATRLLPARLVPAALAVTGELAGPAGDPGDRQDAPLESSAEEPETQQLLRALFAEVLDVAEVGLTDNFLDLGGHSVTAMLLITRVNAALGVRLSIADLFNAPTVRELHATVRARRTGGPGPFDVEDAPYLTLADSRGVHCLWPCTAAVPDGWTTVHGPADREDCLAYAEQHWTDFSPAAGGVPPDTGPEPQAAAADRIPLSFNQEFFCRMDSGAAAGAFSDRHTLVTGWRLHGPLDLASLQLALDDVVARHEVLRTSIRREEEPAHQVIHPPSPVRLEVRDLTPSSEDERQARSEEFMTEVEAQAFSVTELPLLRASLGRLAEQDHVLVLAAHHIAIDAWSMQVVIRDLAGCYAIRRGFDVPLPQVHQYREYCLAQRADPDPEAVRPALDYWRATLRDARQFRLPVSEVAVPAGQTRYAMQHFGLDGELTRASLRLARQRSSSPFMVLLSGFYLLARQLTGATDLVVPTFTPGRHEARFFDTVGPFLNYLPVRTDITGCATFGQVLERTRASCLQAYAHDIPFERIEPVAPTLLSPGSGTPVSFEMVQPPAPVEDGTVGDLRVSEVHRRLMFETGAPDIPDGMLWVLSAVSDAEIIGTVQFKRSEFSAAGIAELVSGYREVLRRAVSAPDDELPPILHTPGEGPR